MTGLGGGAEGGGGGGGGHSVDRDLLMAMAAEEVNQRSWGAMLTDLGSYGSGVATMGTAAPPDGGSGSGSMMNQTLRPSQGNALPSVPISSDLKRGEANKGASSGKNGGHSSQSSAQSQSAVAASGDQQHNQIQQTLIRTVTTDVPDLLDGHNNVGGGGHSRRQQQSGDGDPPPPPTSSERPRQREGGGGSRDATPPAGQKRGGRRDGAGGASSVSAGNVSGLPASVVLGYQSLDPFQWAQFMSHRAPAERQGTQENILPRPKW